MTLLTAPRVQKTKQQTYCYYYELAHRETEWEGLTLHTKDTRLAAAQTFVLGDRVRHKLNGKMGVFADINLGFALPEVWIVFDSDTDSRIPISCNPLDLERRSEGLYRASVFQGVRDAGGHTTV